jgi:regulator of protease activity HflC (stomatin/prohibitin superfamily)
MRVHSTRRDQMSWDSTDFKSAVDDAIENNASIKILKDDVKKLELKIDSIAHDLRGEMQVQGCELRAEMQAQGNELRAEMQAQGNELRAEMKAQGNELRAEMQGIRDEIRYIGILAEDNAKAMSILLEAMTATIESKERMDNLSTKIESHELRLDLADVRFKLLERQKFEPSAPKAPQAEP